MKNKIQKAIANHCKGYNCSQAVACAYHDVLGMEENQVFRLVEGFGSGMGGLRETCGAVDTLINHDKLRFHFSPQIVSQDHKLIYNMIDANHFVHSFHLILNNLLP